MSVQATEQAAHFWKYTPPHSLAEIYTIQGNSHGRPCNLPFLYDGQWFHGCTSVGREDGHLWCATTYDYSRDERWGFCPINSESATLPPSGVLWYCWSA